MCCGFLPIFRSAPGVDAAHDRGLGLPAASQCKPGEDEDDHEREKHQLWDMEIEKKAKEVQTTAQDCTMELERW